MHTRTLGTGAASLEVGAVGLGAMGMSIATAPTPARARR